MTFVPFSAAVAVAAASLTGGLPNAGGQPDTAQVPEVRGWPTAESFAGKALPVQNGVIIPFPPPRTGPEIRDPRLGLPGRLPMDTVRLMDRARWVAGGHQLGGVMVNASQGLIDDAAAAAHLRTVAAEPVAAADKRAAVLSRSFSHSGPSVYHWTLEVVDDRTTDDGTAVVRVRLQPHIMVGARHGGVSGDRPMEVWTIAPDGAVSVEHRDVHQEPEGKSLIRVLTVG